MTQAATRRPWDAHHVPAGHLVFAAKGEAVAIVPHSRYLRTFIEALTLVYGVRESEVVTCLPTETCDLAVRDA